MNRRPDPDDWDWEPFTFVDTHVHIWDLNDSRLHYSYLEPDFVHPQLGDISALKHNYSVHDLLSDFGRVRTQRAVHVQAAFGIADPYDETAYLQEVIDRVGFPTALVANVDLTDPDVRIQLRRHLRHRLVRGIRDQQTGDYLSRPAYLEGCRALEEAGLHLEVETWDDLSPIARLAESIPGLTVVIDHAGRPRDLSRTTLADWSRQMESVAAVPNTVCKISGLGMADPQWTIDSLRPFVEACVGMFGTERCVFGTNWPVDSLYSTYEVLVAAYRSITAGLSSTDQDRLFVGNAERIYRL